MNYCKNISFVLFAIILATFPILVFAGDREAEDFYFPRTLGVDTTNNILFVAQGYAFNGDAYINAFSTKDDNYSPIGRLTVPYNLPTSIVHNPASGLTYITYIGNSRVVILNGSRVSEAGNTAIEGVIDLSGDGTAGYLIDVVPLENEKNIAIIQYGANPKAIIAGSDGAVLNTIKLDRNPISIAVGKGSLFITYGEGFPVLTKIDTTSGAKNDIPLPQDAGKIASFNDKTLVIAGSSEDIVMLVEKETGRVVSTSKTPFRTYFLKTIPGKPIVYGANYFEKSLFVYDGKKVSTVPLSVYPIALFETGGRAVALGHAGFVEVIDLAGAKEPLFFDTLPRRLPFVDLQQYISVIGSDSKNGRLFVNNEEYDSVTGIDISKNKAVYIKSSNKNEQKWISHPVGAAFLGNDIFVGNKDGSVAVFSKDKAKFREKFQIGEDMSDFRRIGTKLYAILEKGPSLAVVDPVSKQVRTVPLPSLNKDVQRGLLRFFEDGTINEKEFGVFDSISGSWWFLSADDEEWKVERQGNGAVRPLLRSSSVDVEVGRDNILRIHDRANWENVRNVLLNGITETFFVSIDPVTSDVVAYGADKLGDAYIVIVNSDGQEKNRFRIGKALRRGAIGNTRQNTNSDTVFHAGYNRSDKNIWVFYPGTVRVYDKEGNFMKNFVYSSGLYHLAVDGTTAFVVGVGSFQLIDLTAGNIIKFWELFPDLLNKITISAATVVKAIIQEDEGVMIVNQYDSISYFNKETESWHVLLNEGGKGFPSILNSNVNNGDNSKRSGTFAFIGIVGLILVILIIRFVVSFKNKTYVETG